MKLSKFQQDMIKDIEAKGGKNPFVNPFEKETEAKPEEVKPEETKSFEKETGVKPEETQPFDFGSIEEKELFNYLTDKAGREIKSFEDFNPKTIEKEVEKIITPELDPEVESFNKFKKDTGRGIEDFYKTQQDWSSENEDTILREYLRNEYPELNDSQLSILIEDEYEIPAQLDSEEHEADELARNRKEIERAKIKKTLGVSKAKKFLEEQKQTYLSPIEAKQKAMEEQIQQGREVWSQRSKEAMSNVKNLEFDDFSYSYKDVDNFAESASSYEGLLNRYKNEQGELDQRKLYTTLLKGEQAESILKDYKNHVEVSVKQAQLGKKANASHLETQPVETGEKTQAEKSMEHNMAQFKKMGIV